MKKAQDITLTRNGGNFYRAMTFHWVFFAIAILPIIIVLILGIINPFWFRTAMFDWIELCIRRITRWRDYVKYRIYLGTDPKMWHALRDESIDQ